MSEPASHDPVDWTTARRVARLVAGRDPLSSSYLGTSLHTDFACVTVEAEELVADFTGLRAPAGVTARVLDRNAWVDANIASTRRLFGPLLERVGARLAHSPLGPVGRHVMGSELGVLLGYLSQRVLGQYDLLVPEDAEDAEDADCREGAEDGAARVTDAVYYVGPNVLALEKRFAFRPRDFRRWIALHEVTHRAQFAGVPWVKPYFLSLVEETMTLLDPDPRVLLRALGNTVDQLRRGRNPLDDGGLMGLVATAEQRRQLDRVQALMSLLEGHGNVVMSELGREHVVGEERMTRILRSRRSAGGLTGRLHKLFGFESKMRQYELGERFVRRVVDEAGFAALDAAWARPENLPTLQEIDRPLDWLARVDGAVYRA